MKKTTQIKLTPLLLSCACAAALVLGTLHSPAADRTWSGAGADDLWSTVANWGGTAPVNNDKILFNGTVRPANTNDLIGLTVSGIQFNNGGFLLEGNTLGLSTTVAGGVLVSNMAGSNTIAMDINPLQANRRWLVAAGSEVILAGANSSAGTSGGMVMLDGGGTVRFTGNTLAVRGMDLTNGTVIVDGGVVDHSNDGLRAKPGAGRTVVTRLINNGTWRWGGGANFRLGNSSAAGNSRMFLESGTLELYGTAVSIFVGDSAVAGSSSIFTQSGGSVLSTGSGNNDLIMGTASGAESVYNLDGGTLMVRRVRANAAGQGTFNLNGGTLMAKVNDALFLEGLAAANVLAGGAIINSSTNNITIAQALQGAGSLTKKGAGTLTLAGGNSYSGSTIVQEGTLVVSPGFYPSGSPLVLSNGTSLSVGGSSISPASLSLGGSNVLNLQVTAPIPAITDPTTVTGVALTTGGSNIVINVSGTGFAAGAVPLIDYTGTIGGTGFAAFELGSLPPGVLGSLSNDTVNTVITLHVSVVVNNLSWYGNVNGDWDIATTLNWRDPFLASTNYNESGGVGDIVTFDDNVFNDFTNPPNTNINVTTTVSPAILTVINGSYPYSFGGAGKISGTTVLNKDGSGALTLTTANDFTGGTVLSNGPVRIASDAALGSGPITLRGGQLSSDGATARTMANPLVLGVSAFSLASILGDAVANGVLSFSGGLDFDGNGAVDLAVNSPVTISGAVGNGGLDQKSGPGTLTLSGISGTMGGTPAGNVQIEDGSVVIQSGTLSKANGGVRIMSLVPGGTSSFTIGSGATVLMEGPGQNIRVGSTSPSGDPTATNILNISGVLTWTTNATSFGQIQMGNSCAFAQVNVTAGGLLRPGTIVHNANTTEINFDGGTLAPTFSTATYMQGLTAANILAGGLTVTTEGLLGEPLAITIAQPLQGLGALSKTGQGTLTLTGTNTYAGQTVVQGGTLVLGAAHAAPGTVVVTNGGALGLLSDAPGVVAAVPSATVGDLTTTGELLAAFSGQSGNPTSPAGYITNLTLNGIVPVSLQLGGVSVGTIPLIRYDTLSGTGSVTSGNLPQGVVGTVQINAGTKTIELVVSSVTPLVWTGAGTNSWDVEVSTNWTLSGSSSVFKQGDNVLFDDTTLNPIVAMVQTLNPGSVVVSNDALAYSFTANGGLLSGGMNLIKEGGNALTLAGANSFSGTVTVKEGTLLMGNNSALGSTAGATIVENGGTLDLNNFDAPAGEVISIAGAGQGGVGALNQSSGTDGNANSLQGLVLTADASVGAASGVRYGMTATASSITTSGGDHTLTKVGPGQFDARGTVAVGPIVVQEGIFQTQADPAFSSGFGLTVLPGAEFRIFNLNPQFPREVTLTNATLNVTGGTDLQNQFTNRVNLQSQGTVNVTAGFFVTLAGEVAGSGTLIKGNPGTLILNASNSYSGSTLISNGTVQLGSAGSIGTSPSIFVDTGATFDVSLVAGYTLGAGQTLGGNGTVNGNVTAIGTLAPGSSIGTLTFNNDLTLGGTTVMELTRDGAVTNDVLAVTGNLAYGGTLAITVSGTNALQINDTFDLFSFTVAPLGAFSPITWPAGYGFDTTQLGVDGTVRVTAVPPTLPTVGTNISYSLVSGGTEIQLTWPPEYQGWILQTQTNALSVGLQTSTNAWVDVPGTDLVNSTNLPILKTIPTTFYRLRYP